MHENTATTCRRERGHRGTKYPRFDGTFLTARAITIAVESDGAPAAGESEIDASARKRGQNVTCQREHDGTHPTVLSLLPFT